jgi:hypothetical protein
VVVMVTPKITIFDKQGNRIFEQSLNGSTGFWGSLGGSPSVSEPWVIFDPNSSRFIASAADFGSAKGTLYLAVSTTSSPSNSADWHKYRIDRTGTHQAAGFAGVPTYPDYARVGVDQDAVYVTSLHFAKDQNVTQLFSHAEIFSLDKASLLNGGPSNLSNDDLVYNEPVIVGSPAFSLQPAVVHGPSPAMYFVSCITRQPSSEIMLHAISGGVRTSSVVPVAAYQRPPDVPQKGSTTLLQNIDARVMSAVVRDGSLWTAHAIRDSNGDTESLVRWYEFDITGLPAVPAALVQAGNVDPGPGVHAWLPSISVDATGSMALVFSIGGASQYAAIGYTGRLAGDAPGTTREVFTARSGSGAYSLTGWGEYSGLAVDPDGFTFWLFHEYPTKAGNWATYAGAFQINPMIQPMHVGDLDGMAVNQGPKWKGTVVVTLHDPAHQPVAGASVSGAWSGGFTGTATATTDANGQCMFATGLIPRSSTSATFSVTGALNPSFSYAGGTNHDPDGDSNGTSISVTRP